MWLCVCVCVCVCINNRWLLLEPLKALSPISGSTSQSGSSSSEPEKDNFTLLFSLSFPLPSALLVPLLSSSLCSPLFSLSFPLLSSLLSFFHSSLCSPLSLPSALLSPLDLTQYHPSSLPL